MTRRATVYLTATSTETLGDGPLSTSLNRAIDRYREILRRARVDLTYAERDAVRDALRGWAAEPAAMIAGGPALEVMDAIEDGLAERHGVDGRALIEKLRALTFEQEVALVDSVERYWRSVSAAASARSADGAADGVTGPE